MDQNRFFRLYKIMAISFALVCLIIFIYNKNYSNTTFTTSYKEMMLKNEFNGYIIKIEEDKSNRFAITYTFNNGGYKLYALASKWDKMLSIGDYIIKSKNSLVFRVKKANGEQFSFDYNEYLNKLGYYSKNALDN